MRYPIAALIVIITSLSAAHADEIRSAVDAKPKMDDLAWLVGSWHGEGLGGRVEEHWTMAAGGTMLGAFRLVREEKVHVIEYVMITEEEDRIALRFKHFRPDYSTWEKDLPLDFTLLSVSGHEAIFHSEVPDQNSPRRITYRLTEEGELSAVIAGTNAKGQLEEKFEIRLARN